MHLKFVWEITTQESNFFLIPLQKNQIRNLFIGTNVKESLKQVNEDSQTTVQQQV